MTDLPAVADIAPTVTTSEEHRRIQWTPGTTIEILLEGSVSGGTLSIVSIRAEQPYITPVHVHRGDDEVFLVLEGAIRVWVGDRRFDTGSGGVAFLPRDVPHAYAVTSDTAKLIGITTSNALSELFPAAGWDLQTSAPEGWSLSFDAVRAAAAWIGHPVLGAPPSLDAARIEVA